MPEPIFDGSPESAAEWPYEIRYDVVNEIEADVIILGGGIAGAWAAIEAAKKGVKVALIEKSATIRSGAGGAGVDHWQQACTNPCSKVTPERMATDIQAVYGGYNSGISRYLTCRESYDTLLELEEMGVQIRDVDDEFEGAKFRDEETKFLFAYDYETRYTMRIWGNGAKPALYYECKRLGVRIFDRVAVTSLLNEGGKAGGRVVGATAVNTRTGEFYVFKAKASITALSMAERVWMFSTELQGFEYLESDPNNGGEGFDLPCRAGADMTMMEKAYSSPGPFTYPFYATGACEFTYYAANIVDANGKEIPWVDRDGNVLKNHHDRYRPCEGQDYFLMGGCMGEANIFRMVDKPEWYEHRGPGLTPDLPERIAKGEFELPLYADLPGTPEHERKAIWGLMVGQEVKTMIPIYHNYTRAGFDPDKDMLQVPLMANMEGYSFGFFCFGVATPHWRTNYGNGGVVVDWNLRSTVEGLYAAGTNIFGEQEHAMSACTGKYAARNAADYAKTAAEPVIDQDQVEREKERVYAPIKRKEGVEWKELHAGIGRIMQDYCGEYKNDRVLELGIERLRSIRESEAQTACARNPHELMRMLEVLSLLNVGETIMHASLARKASNSHLSFNRLDYPEMDPPEWDKMITVRMEDGEYKCGALELHYELKPPYAPSFRENYEKHKAMDGLITAAEANFQPAPSRTPRSFVKKKQKSSRVQEHVK